MRVVLDTNIWISGLMLPSSQAGKTITAWKEEILTIVTSPAIIEEITRVLAYPKIQKRIQWSNDKINQFAILLPFNTEYWPAVEETVVVERDADDSAILATLLTSKADYLVTGDQDLLSLQETYPKIITLADFMPLFM